MLDSELEAIVVSEVLKQGSLSFMELMALTQYSPSCGYYMRSKSPFGNVGDFVTAPMMSPLLAKAVSSWIKAKGVDEVLEIAPGNGELATQILKNHPEIKRYYLLDKNPQALRSTDFRLEVVSSIPKAFSGAVIANEWLDALPFRRFVWKKDGLFEFRVKGSNSGLEMYLSPVNEKPLLHEYTKTWSEPYVFEEIDYSPLKALREHKGPCLLIDYGYEEKELYHPDRMLGSMICIKKHQVIPFALKTMGSYDITCAVNWSEVTRVMDKMRYEQTSFGTQADFLRYFLEHECYETNPLVASYEMGQYIKVSEYCPSHIK